MYLPPAAAQPPAQSQGGFVYNGITHVSWWFDEYNNFGQPTGTGTDSRTELAATKAGYAGVLVTQYQANATATAISPDSTKTPTDQAVTFAINELHAKGIKVMLKPHVDSEDGAWRGTFQPSNPDAWFQSFNTFVLHYAQLAQSLNVELLCIGTEYLQISGAANQARWYATIAAIRQVYTGKLVYAANATYPGDEFTTVSFWDQLDLLGLDAYFPLTNHADPTLSELIAAWRSNEYSEDLVATVQNFADAHQKPLIFTEIGYKSVAGANTQPYNYSFPGALDLTEQQNCYTAFYNVWSPQNSWMQGVFWWAWPVPPPAATDTDYNPRGKPAETVLKTYQGPPSGGPGFNLAANPVNTSVVQGSTLTANVAINPSGGFTSPVALSVGGLPAGITATLNPATVTGSSSQITFTVAATVPVGTVTTATVTGTGGGITSSATIKLTVVTPDFTLSSNPSQLNVHQGGTAISTINIAQIGGFSGSVAFSASNLPSGVTAVFSPPSTTGTFSTVTFTASSTAALASASVQITGTSGSLTHTTTINVTVQTPLDDFTLAADSPSVSLGGTVTGNVTITPEGIFAGAVTLSASGVPGGVTLAFSPNPAATTSTMTFTVASNAPLGTATINLTGTSGTISHSILIHLTVNQIQAPDFSLSGTNSTVSAGGTGTSAISVAPLGGFTGSVSLVAAGLPTGVTAVFNPATTTAASTLTFTAAATATAGTTFVTVTGTSGALTHATTVSLAVSAAPDFSLSAAPASLTIIPGLMGTSSIVVTPIGGFAGSVSLSAIGLPGGVIASFSPNPVPANGTSTLTLTIPTTVVTNFTVTVSATAGATSHTFPIQVIIGNAQDFSLAATNAAAVPGGTGTSTVSIARIGGFTGAVGLSASGLPAGVTAAFTPASTTATTATLTFTASATAATGPSIVVTITGVSGTLTHTTSLALTVNPPPDFSIVAPANITVSQGQSASGTITISPLGGFAGAVALSASGLPVGVTAVFTPASATTTSALTVTAAATAAAGTYPVTITGTSGTLSHTAAISLTVTPPVVGTGGVTLTTVVNSNSQWFDDQGLKLSNTAPITALSIAITVQNTGGITFNGQYNTVGGSIVQSHAGAASAITYQFTLLAGQTLGPGTGWLFDAQMGGNGTLHPTTGDSFTVAYTTGGNMFTQSGRF